MHNVHVACVAEADAQVADVRWRACKVLIEPELSALADARMPLTFPELLEQSSSRQHVTVEPSNISHTSPFTFTVYETCNPKRHPTGPDETLIIQLGFACLGSGSITEDP